jgi:hypothetical protein
MTMKMIGNKKRQNVQQLPLLSIKISLIRVTDPEMLLMFVRSTIMFPECSTGTMHAHVCAYMHTPAFIQAVM